MLEPKHIFYLFLSALLIALLVSCDANYDQASSTSTAPEWPVDLVAPIEGTTFPLAENHLPGTPHDYHAGTRQGFVFANGHSGRILPADTTAVAVAGGEVVRIDQDYTDPGKAVLEYWADQADNPGFLGDYTIDQLRGRQVWIRHENGHISRYAHLSRVNPELAPGDTVEQGQPLGLIGTSGLLARKDQKEPDARLHFELWSPDATHHLCQDADPLDCHRQVRNTFSAEALPRYARRVLEQVDEGEPAPDPYPPEELPETGFTLDPPTSLTAGAPFAAPVTWKGDDFQPEDFFSRLAGRPMGVIDAGNGAWLLGALPMNYEESRAELIAGAADAYGQTLVGNQSLKVIPRESDLESIEVSEAVMRAHSDRDTQNEARALVEAGLRSLDTTTPRWTAPFHAPLEGKVTRRFGQEIFHGLLRSAHPLPGVMIEAGAGDAVNAANAGRVVGVVELPVRGNTVVIDHGGGVISVYTHLAETRVAEGNDVQRDQTLGLAGDSGATDEFQVRWEIHVAGTPTDPLDWHQSTLPNRQASPSN